MPQRIVNRLAMLREAIADARTHAFTLKDEGELVAQIKRLEMETLLQDDLPALWSAIETASRLATNIGKRFDEVLVEE